MPAGKADFFGREELAIWAERQFIAQRRLLIVHGPHKIGKTTFLHFLPDLLAVDQASISYSLQDLTEFSVVSLLRYLLQTGVESLSRDALIDPAEIRLSADPVAGLNDLLTYLQTRYPKRLVLFLLDDLDRLLDLNRDESAIFLDACQSLLAEQPQLRLVITCTDTALPHFSHPLLDTAPTRPIGPLTAAIALQFISRPVEGVIRFDYGVTKRIAEINSNHPYYLALFNQILFTRYAREGWVNLRHLDETLAAVLETEIPTFDDIWQEATWVERAVLMAMASFKGVHGVFSRQEILPVFSRQTKEADEQVIITALESLTFRGVLVKMGALSYRFHVDLFRFWLQRHHQFETILQQVIWAQPANRPEPAPKLQPGQKGTDDPLTKSPAGLQWPTWVIALMGLTIVGLLAGLFLMVNDYLAPAPAAVEGPVGAGEGPAVGDQVVKFETSTPFVPTITPTAEPTLTATPTPPRVTAKTIPSIAYMARQGQAPWQIYVMNVDGSGIESISDVVANDTTPVWSPAGDKLTFVSQRDGNREIYVMDVDGRNLLNLTNHPADDGTPSWSPDGSRIAFSSNRQANWEIFIINADGTDLRQLTNTEGGNISPVWSPDGQMISFSSKRDGNWEIYTMRLDGSDLRRLTFNEVNDLAPVWSYSGDLIAYETNIDGDVEIYVMTSAGGNARNVSSLPYANDHGPVWAPDDTRLAFYSNREGNWDLFSVNLDGSNTLNLTNTPNIDEQTPAWRP